jgi:Na+-translocating ferredoxin:NAD+ oxidoreductase RnfG subunit
MHRTVNVALTPQEKLVRVFAYTTLLAAFILGQIASQTDYEALLQQQMPEAELTRNNVQKELPVVYQFQLKGELSPDVVVMADGVGYGGPMVVGIRARRTDEGGKLSEILVLAHKETPSFMNRVSQGKFFRQFAGKSVTDNFIIDDDIDAVSGATVTSEGFAKAIREAVHLGAVQHLKLSPTWRTPSWTLGMNEGVLTGLFLLAFVGAYRRDKAGKYARYLVMAGALVFVGFYANASLSLGNLAGIVMGYIPPVKQHPMWWIMMVGAVGSVVILGRNIYCHQICPFNHVQDLLQKISGVKLRIKPAVQRQARTLIFTLSWAALVLIFLSAHPALGSYEPFAMMFSLEGMGIQWYILPAALLGSFFVPSFWCRLFCPVGLFLNEGVRARRALRNRFFGDNKKKVKLDPVKIVGGDDEATGEKDRD